MVSPEILSKYENAFLFSFIKNFLPSCLLNLVVSVCGMLTSTLNELISSKGTFIKKNLF